MHYFSPASVLAVFSLVFGSCLLSPAARADSFSIYEVATSSGSIHNYGLTTDGSLTTSRYNPFGGPYVNIYTTFTPPSSTVTSNTPPPFTFDNGSACSVSAAGLSRISAARCNGAYSLFSAYTATSDLPSLYLMTGSMLQQIYFGPSTQWLLNALGDVAFDGLFDGTDRNMLYYNNTSHAAAAVTPEPSSALLLLSGVCCCAILLWRQRQALTA